MNTVKPSLHFSIVGSILYLQKTPFQIILVKCQIRQYIPSDVAFVHAII